MRGASITLQAWTADKHSDSHLQPTEHLGPATFPSVSTNNILSPYFFWSHSSDSYDLGCTTTSWVKLQLPKQTISASLERNPEMAPNLLIIQMPQMIIIQSSPLFWPHTFILPFKFLFVPLTLSPYKLWASGKSLELSVPSFFICKRTNSINLIGKLLELSELLYVKCLE